MVIAVIHGNLTTYTQMSAFYPITEDLSQDKLKRQTLDHFTIKLCNCNVVRQSETVFLGVILDEHLS